MSLTRTYARNVVASYLSIAFILATAFFYTPFLIKRLGTTRYGLLVLTASVGGYLTLLDLGFVHANRRFLANALLKGNPDEVNEVFGVGMRLYGSIGLLVLAGGLSAIWWLPLIVAIPREFHGEFVAAMAAGAVSVSKEFFHGTFTAVTFAANRIDLYRGLEVVKRVCLVGISVVLILLWRADLYAIAVTTIVSTGIVVVIAYLFAKRTCPALKLNLGSWRSPVLRPMLTFSASAMCIALGVTAVVHSPKLLAGALLNVEAVARLAVPLLVATYIRAFIQATASPLFPTASFLVGNQQRERLQDLYVRATRLCGMLVLSAAISLSVFGEAFLGHWLGPEFGRMWRVLVVVLVGEVLLSSQLPAEYMLMATGRVAGIAAAQLTRAIVMVVLIVLFTLGWGMGTMGIAMALTICTCAYAALFMPLNACSQFGIPLSRYVLGTVPRLGAVLASSAGLHVLVRIWWQPTSLLMAVGALLAGMSVTFALGLALALDGQDRRRLASLLPGRRRSEPPAAPAAGAGESVLHDSRDDRA